MKLLKAVVLNGYRPRKDKSVTLTFETQEQGSHDIAEIHDLVGHYGVLFFKNENQLTEKELQELESVELEYFGKTKSKRLKNVLYRLWQQEEEDTSHEDFYALEMEKIINHYKNKLE